MQACIGTIRHQARESDKHHHRRVDHRTVAAGAWCFLCARERARECVCLVSFFYRSGRSRLLQIVSATATDGWVLQPRSSCLVAQAHNLVSDFCFARATNQLGVHVEFRDFDRWVLRI